MANLKEIRVRIASVTSTRQITSAMKMVSAAKLRKAQEAIVQMRPYATKLHEILVSLIGNLGSGDGNAFGQVRNPEKVLLVVITSNKGMCGAFNANVVKAANYIINEEYAQLAARGNVHLLTIGKKAYDAFKSRKIPIYQSRPDLFDKMSFENTVPVVEDLMQKFLAHEYDRVILIYNQFKNAAVQILTTEQFLPVKMEVPEDGVKQNFDFVYEPSQEEIVEELIPKSLKIQFHKALLDSFAAEHGARMTAMYKATDNATELLKDLKLHYNKVRQASITNEILEIVSGANALGK
ncbi:MAG: ATP synthase F1 subunit gamma [Bacteroidales bacterium]